jgi:Zn-dependent membrane protease YugP
MDVKFMRTLVATALSNAKGKDVFCKANKVTDQHLKTIRNTDRKLLEETGFTFIKMLSLEYPNVRGYVIFFEGHYDEMVKALKLLEKGYQ